MKDKKKIFKLKHHEFGEVQNYDYLESYYS